MNKIDYPYRECVQCDGAICCKNLVVEELTGRPKPPEDCLKKTDIQSEIDKHYDVHSQAL